MGAKTDSALPAQVKGKDVLRNVTLFPHVVKDRDDPREAEVGVGQAQDAIEVGKLQVDAGLLHAQPKCLVLDHDVGDLQKKRGLWWARAGQGSWKGESRPVCAKPVFS